MERGIFGGKMVVWQKFSIDILTKTRCRHIRFPLLETVFSDPLTRFLSEFLISHYLLPLILPLLRLAKAM